MEFDEVIYRRRSIRRYHQQYVAKELLDEIFRTARAAPSSTNTQPWRFLSVTSQEYRKQIIEVSYNQKWMETAPVIIVCCTDLLAFFRKNVAENVKKLIDTGALQDTEEMRDYVNSRPERFEQLDAIKTSALLNAAIAIEHMVLKAVEVGLGTCWVHLVDKEKVHRICNLPDHILVVGLLTVGYPAESPSPRPRLALEQIYLGEL